MKIKSGFIGYFIIFVMLFTACDSLNGQTNNNNISGIPIIRPMIQSKWSQSAPFNNLFPVVKESDGYFVDNNSRAYTNCNNTAMAQIMHFYKYPARGSGQGNILYLYPKAVTVPNVNFNVPYEWNNMLNLYPEANSGTAQQRNAVATLLYHVVTAAGANNGSLITALVNNFDYDRNIQYLFRKFYTNAEWETKIKQQLDAGMPVWYWGDDPSSAHTFIIDGYDNNGNFHINMGWNGTDDGWYSLDNINPRAYGGKRMFYNNQQMIINIKPNAGGTGINEMMLSSFTASKTTVSQNEQFTVTPNIRSTGFVSSGQLGVALVDNNGRIVAIIGTRDMWNNWQPQSGGAIEINCSVPNTVAKGQYRLMHVTRLTGGDWKIVTAYDRENNTSNSINITVR